MEEALKNTKEIPGLVSMHQDTTNGKLFMVINKDQLDKEYIHFVHYLNGTVNAGVHLRCGSKGFSQGWVRMNC